MTTLIATVIITVSSATHQPIPPKIQLPPRVLAIEPEKVPEVAKIDRKLTGSPIPPKK